MAILMTGLTGILGSEIHSNLHDQDDIYYIVRDGLNNLKLPIGIDPEKVLKGDVTLPQCGLSSMDIKNLKAFNIKKFVHLAANVSFVTEDVNGEIYKTNYNGTKNAIELAHRLECEEFHYCSTSFVEDRRNPYEASKMAAEELVKNSGIPFSIYRPSAIVGNSETGLIPSFNGYYGAFAIFQIIAGRSRQSVDTRVSIPVYVTCSEHTTLNLIPIDWVVSTMIQLMFNGVKNEVYYLADHRPKLARWVISKSFDILNISDVNFLDYLIDKQEKEQLHEGNRMSLILQKHIDTILDRFTPYITNEREFSLNTVIRALGKRFVEPPEITEELLSTLLKYAVEVNFGYKNK